MRKDIIQQEREMYLDDPDSCLFFRTLANLYPETPLAADIVGTEMSIQDISVSDLEEKFQLVLHSYKYKYFSGR